MPRTTCLAAATRYGKDIKAQTVRVLPQGELRTAYSSAPELNPFIFSHNCNTNCPSRYYRAMRMHSADYAVARCPSVCTSVRHTPVLCLNDYMHISSVFFSPSGNLTIPVFPYQTGWRYSDMNPLNGGVECKGVWKNHDFRPIYRFISE